MSYKVPSALKTCVYSIASQLHQLKGQLQWKKNFFFIPSIDRVCGSDAQEKKLDFLHGSVRRYKTLRSTNCGCGHLMQAGGGGVISI